MDARSFFAANKSCRAITMAASGRFFAPLLGAALITAARANYYGDSAASVFDEKCQCIFNCQYCMGPTLSLSNSLATRSNRIICDAGLQPPSNAVQAWATLTSDDGANGYCKNADGYGEYMTIYSNAGTALTQQACELICAQASACMAYEWAAENTRCELHADMPTTVQAVAAGGVMCRAKTPPPNTQPLADTPCCPTFEAQLNSVTDYSFSLRVRPSPWVPGKSVLLQIPGLVINDPEVRISLERASYVGMGDGQGGVAAPSPPPADGDDGEGVAGRRLCGSCHRSHAVDPTILATTGIVLRLVITQRVQTP